jgi:signal transduction histidine kinase
MRHLIGRGRTTIPLSCALLASTSHSAQAAFSLAMQPEQYGFGWMAVSLGLLLATLTTAYLYARLRLRTGTEQSILRGLVTDMRARLERAEALAAAEPQIVVTFGAPGEEPDISGALPPEAAVPAGRKVLAFGSWTSPERARLLEDQVERLRARGEGFEMVVPARQGEQIALDGRAVGGRAVLRIRRLHGERLALADLQARHAEMQRELARFHALLDRLPQPAWLRDKDGRIAWANAAYAETVERPNGEAAAAANADILEAQARRKAALTTASGENFHEMTPVVTRGERRVFDVFEVPHDGGAAGLAVDMTELESVKSDLVRRVESHRKTFDELATGVAIFAADQRLAFYNHAFHRLWQLDAAFLAQEPTDGAILDRLRAEELLPEPADFRAWKAQLAEAYRALEPREHWWHLPDGRTLRVVQTPNPEGGVTYLFDDVTEKVDLESKFNALTRVQRETLDHLRDAVAVFGSDGRLRLHNPVFAQMWRLPQAELAAAPHAARVFSLCKGMHAPSEPWDMLKTAVTAIPESRKPVHGRIERIDGKVIELATVPLPDGATLVTFSDITDAIRVERALTERNEALEAAGLLKSNFVKHVSYELRAPLTNVIGFAQLLADPATGKLSTRQREYSNHILDSSAGLYAIINDILDLTTIDAGTMELELTKVDIRAAVDAAVEGMRGRLADTGITLDIKVPKNIGSFTADEKRVRQVLFNLLSNAIGFSPEDRPVTLTAERADKQITFRVTDEGKGIDPDQLDRVFERFETRTEGSRHRGVGLGLSIVRSFVELHGGSVAIETQPGKGTTVTCIFPAGGGGTARAAA